MGLVLEVGILSDLRENDEEGYEYFLDQFNAINIHLKKAGLPTHQEPAECEAWEGEMYGYSGLHYLRRIAAYIDCDGKLPSPGDENAHKDNIVNNYYEKYLGKSPGIVKKIFAKSWNYKLEFNHLMLHNDAEGFYLPVDFEEVQFTDDALKIAGNMIGSSIRLLQECERLAKILEIPADLHDQSDELWEAADAQGESPIKWKKYGVESFTCVNLLIACRKSIETGAAIVFG
jgi:hypothetical protein